MYIYICIYIHTEQWDQCETRVFSNSGPKFSTKISYINRVCETKVSLDCHTQACIYMYIYTYFYICINNCRNAVHKSSQILCALEVWNEKDEARLRWVDNAVDVKNMFAHLNV